MRWLLVGLALATVVALFVILRPDDEGDSALPSAATAESTVPTGTETATTPTVDAVRDRVVRITVRDGRPVGGIVRETIAEGERVRLVVRADVRDHVHLHGYDVMRDVGPGAAAELVFTADVVGRFDVELEESHLLIAQLEVRP